MKAEQNKMTQPIPLHVLCAYLPYSPKIQWRETKETMGITFYDETDYNKNLYPLSTLIYSLNKDWDNSWGLLLRPLSDLSKPLPELEGKTALKKIKEILSVRDGAWPKVYLDSEYKEGTPGIVIMPLGNTISIRCVPDYYMIPLDALDPVRELLLSLHFDLFGAIQKGWALDLNGEKP